MQQPKPPAYQVLMQPPATRPTTTYGNIITPNAVINTYGTWTNIGVPSATHDTYLLDLMFNSVFMASNTKCTMAEVGIDPAGGTSFTTVIPSIVLGSPGSYNDNTGARPTSFRIPFFIPAGASIGVRGKQNSATTTAFRCAVRAWGKPSRPDLVFAGRVCEAIGANPANSQGTAIVPGTTSEGAWTLIGTCTRNLKWIDFGYAIDSVAVTAQAIHVDVAYGDGTTFNTVLHDGHVTANANEIVQHERSGEYCDIPAGSNLYARAQLSLGTVDANQSIALYGVA